MVKVTSLETKGFISNGLSDIHNPLLKELIANADYSISRYGGLCPHTVGFYVTPAINATIRFGSAEDKMLVFESMLVWKSEELIPSTKRGCKGQLEMRATQAARTAISLKRKQDESVEQTMLIMEQIIKDKQLDNNKIIAIKVKSGTITNKNITGLIANKLAKKYNHPVLLLNEVETEDGISWAGSGRGVDTPALESFKDFLIDSGYTEYASGHANAMGSSIQDKDFEEFIAYSNEALADCDFEPCAVIDFEWDSKELKFKNIIDIASLNMLYGQGLECPKVVIKNIVLNNKNLQLRGEKCPTITIDLGNNIKAIKFRGADIFEKIKPKSETGVTIINILGTCAINEFNGSINAQIEIEDYEIVNQ